MAKSKTPDGPLKTAEKQPTGRPFPPGVSGNPGGRPKGLAAYVREQTQDGREMVDFMVKVMRGEPLPRVLKPATLTAEGGVLPELKVEMSPTLDEQMTAVGWLADRGFGKALQKVDGEVRMPIQIVHRTPRYDPLAVPEERVLDVEATVVPPRRALSGPRTGGSASASRAGR